MPNEIDPQMILQFSNSIDLAKKDGRTITIYDKRDHFVFQGKVVYLNKSYFIVENQFNIRESFLLADMATGEQKIS